MGAIGRFQLEGALQSAHVHRCRSGRVRLAAGGRSSTTRSSPSPPRRWWRSTARWPSRSCDGAAAGLAALDAVAGDPRLAEYQPYWAARAELLARTGAAAAARDAYALAIGLERDPAVRRFLQHAQAALPGLAPATALRAA